MKTFVLLLAFTFVLIGCGSPYSWCEGLTGEPLEVGILNLQHRLNAWQNTAQIVNYNHQQQQNRTALMAPQPIAPVISQQFGSIVRSY